MMEEEDGGTPAFRERHGDPARAMEKRERQSGQGRRMVPSLDGGDAHPEAEEAASAVLDAAFRIHSELGPGLLEHLYQRCLAIELRDRGHRVVVEAPLEVEWREQTISGAYRVDLLVDERFIVELKSVERLDPLHTAQVFTYLQLADLELALLVNFNVERLKDGIKRIIHTDQASRSDSVEL